MVKVTAKYTDQQFVATYSGRRRTMYEKAMQSLTERPFRKADSYVKFFVKAEKVNFTSKPDSAPRGISPRDKRYNCKLGPYVKRVEKSIYTNIDKIFGGTTVMKGLNAGEVGSALATIWRCFDNPVAIGIDAKRFDQHVSQAALKYEHLFYKTYYPHDKTLPKLLRMQLVNKGRAFTLDGKVSFVVQGRRMSGDMNTGSGNVILMCAMMHAFCNRFTKYRLANNGDDCVLFLERNEFYKTADLGTYFNDFGFRLEIEQPVYQLEKVVLCQANPVFDGKSWVMVRHYPQCVSKDAVSIKPLDNQSVFRKWCSAIGQCGISLNGGIPIYQEYFNRLTEISCGSRPLVGDPTLETGWFRLAERMNRVYEPVGDTARVSFWRAFGVEPDKQLVIEEIIRKTMVNFELPDLILEPHWLMK
jgi:hypothetical protein